MTHMNKADHTGSPPTDILGSQQNMPLNIKIDSLRHTLRPHGVLNYKNVGDHVDQFVIAGIDET